MNEMQFYEVRIAGNSTIYGVLQGPSGGIGNPEQLTVAARRGGDGWVYGAPLPPPARPMLLAGKYSLFIQPDDFDWLARGSGDFTEKCTELFGWYLSNVMFPEVNKREA